MENKKVKGVTNIKKWDVCREQGTHTALCLDHSVLNSLADVKGLPTLLIKPSFNFHFSQTLEQYYVSRRNNSSWKQIFFFLRSWNLLNLWRLSAKCFTLQETPLGYLEHSEMFLLIRIFYDWKKTKSNYLSISHEQGDLSTFSPFILFHTAGKYFVIPWTVYLRNISVFC